MFNLSGKKALVTGSTQGIGKAIASCLASQGALVFVHGATSLEKCEKAAAQIGFGAKTAFADLGDANCAELLYRQTGDLDILVLNASVQIRKEWNKITAAEFERQMEVNVRGSLFLIQQYAPHMLHQGWGRIVTVGSVQQYVPHPQMLVYAASKEAQCSLMKNLAKQFAPHGVTVNNIAPGVIATPRNDRALGDPEYAKRIYAGIPMGHAGKPEDCAGAALLLCSEEGRYLTGADLTVDGGMRL